MNYWIIVSFLSFCYYYSSSSFGNFYLSFAINCLIVFNSKSNLCNDLFIPINHHILFSRCLVTIVMTGHWKQSVLSEPSDEEISVELAVRILFSKETFRIYQSFVLFSLGSSTTLETNLIDISKIIYRSRWYRLCSLTFSTCNNFTYRRSSEPRSTRSDTCLF